MNRIVECLCRMLAYERAVAPFECRRPQFKFIYPRGPQQRQTNYAVRILERIQQRDLATQGIADQYDFAQLQVRNEPLHKIHQAMNIRVAHLNAINGQAWNKDAIARREGGYDIRPALRVTQQAVEKDDGRLIRWDTGIAEFVPK